MDQPHLTLTEGKLLVNGVPKAGFSFNTIAPDYPYAIWMPQVVFLNALLEKARPFAGFHCWMGAHVKELIEENGSVVGVRGVQPREKLRLKSARTWWSALTADFPRFGGWASLMWNTSTTIST